MNALIAILILCAASWAQEVVPLPTLETETDSIQYDVAPWPVEGKCPLPKYPELAGKAGVSGKVVVWLNIDTLGRVVESRVSEAKPPKIGFEQEVKKTCLNWTFSPAKSKDRMVNSWIDLSFEFRSTSSRTHESYSLDSLAAAEQTSRFIDSTEALHDLNHSFEYVPPPILIVGQLPVRNVKARE